MGRLVRLPVALVTVFLLAAVPAHAAEAPADSYPQLGVILPIARAAWPDSPCRDHETIDVIDFAAIPGGEGILGSSPLPGRDRCLVLLDTTLFAGDPYLLCVLVTHEFGHLDGQVHSDDRWSIMYPFPDYYPPCEAARTNRLPDPPALTPVYMPPVQTAPPAKHAKPAGKHRRAKCRQKHRKARRACIRKRHKRAHSAANKRLSYARATAAIRRQIQSTETAMSDAGATLIGVDVVRCLRQSRSAIQCFGQGTYLDAGVGGKMYCAAYYRATLRAGRATARYVGGGHCEQYSQL